MNVNSTIAAGEQVAEILKFSTGQVTSTDGYFSRFEMPDYAVKNFAIHASEKRIINIIFIRSFGLAFRKAFVFCLK